MAQEKESVVDDKSPASADANELKNRGNECIKARDFDGAIENYTKAIELEPKNYIFYSNRCAAYQRKGEHNKALEDAYQCTSLAPGWPKGYVRVAHSLNELGRFEEALERARFGLNLTNQAVDKRQSDSNGSSVPSPENLRSHRASLRVLVKSISKRISTQFFQKLKGPWSGAVPEELGGYEQEIHFQNNWKLLIRILDREVVGAFSLDATETPMALDMMVYFEQVTGPRSAPMETMKYICKLEKDSNGEDVLTLCAPDPANPTQRPKEFIPNQTVSLRRGELNDKSEDSARIEGMSDEEKILGYINEALLLFPGDSRLMPLASDSEDTQREISLLNIKFQTANHKITRKYGNKVEETVRKLIVGAEVAQTLSVKTATAQLRKKMQTAMLLPSDQELENMTKQQVETSNVPQQSTVESAPLVAGKEVEEASKTEESGFKKKQIERYVAIALGVVTGITLATYLMRRYNTNRNQ